jgi:hypothetical protein
MAANIGGGGALRVCDGCGLVDDHPRHVLSEGDPGVMPQPSREIIAKVIEGEYPQAVTALAIDQLNEPGMYLHMDCCRGRGCPTGACDRVPDLRGAELLDALIQEG